MPEPASQTHFRNLNATPTQVTLTKASILKMIVTNASGQPAFVQVFDADPVAITLGTSIPMFSVPCAATAGFTSVNFDGGLLINQMLTLYSTTTPEGSSGSNSGVFGQCFIR